MGWVKQVPMSHTCIKPSVNYSKPNGPVGNGSLWQCDDCEKMWILHGWVWTSAHLHEDGVYRYYRQIETGPNGRKRKPKRRWSKRGGQEQNLSAPPPAPTRRYST